MFVVTGRGKSETIAWHKNDVVPLTLYVMLLSLFFVVDFFVPDFFY